MKNHLIISLLIILFGCSKPINDDVLIDKDGLKYHPDTKELYSGKVFKNYIRGQRKYEGSYKNGKEDGLRTWWWENGQKSSERTYKDGKLDGLWTSWYENGQMEFEHTLKDGKLDGLWTTWFDNGQMKFEHTYKDGKLISRKYWNKDGSVKE